jgi:hypothetical protein
MKYTAGMTTPDLTAGRLQSLPYISLDVHGCCFINDDKESRCLQQGPRCAANKLLCVLSYNALHVDEWSPSAVQIKFNLRRDQHGFAIKMPAKHMLMCVRELLNMPHLLISE